MQWLLKALYETFGVPYPRVSLVVVVILGAVVFGGAWVFASKQVAKDHPRSPTVEAPRTGNATTSGSNSPAVTGNGNDIQYSEPSPPKKKKP